jgi:integrase/recombinase XerD
MRYPADPPTVEEIIAVMRHAGEDRHGARLRALLAVLWRGGLRVQEALALTERVARRAPRVAARAQRQGWAPPRDRDGRLGLGAVAALAHVPTRAADWVVVLHHRRPDSRASLVKRRGARRASPPRQAGVRRRFCATPAAPRPHPLAGELKRVALNIIQRQLGHANLGTTSIYLQGIETEEIIATVHARRAPMRSATAGLRL